MYVVLSAFLGSTVARPEDSGKAISPLMMLVIFSFLGVTTLGSAGDVFLLKIGSYIPFFSTFFMLSVPSMAMRLVLMLGFIGLRFSLPSWEQFSSLVIYASLILQTDDLGPWKTIKRALSYR